MRSLPSIVLGSAFVILLSNGCGGKVLEPSDDSGGTGGSGGSSGSGGSYVGGSGGSYVGGSGGSYVGGSGGSYVGGSAGDPVGGSGGGPAGAGGGPGGSGGYAGGACWSLMPATTSCRECMDMNCCSEVINCFSDPDSFCPIALDCFESCVGDPSECATECDQGMFNLPFNEVYICGKDWCTDVCTNTTQPVCPIETSDPVCDDCIQSECAYECNACIDNSDCINLLMCLQDCTSDACYQQCFSQYPAGVDPLFAFLGDDGCLATSCYSECM